MDIEELLNQAGICLNNNDSETAQEILEELEKMELTPKLKYAISQLLRDLGFKTQNMDYIDQAIINFEELEYFGFEDINFSLGTAYALKYQLLEDKPNYLTKNYKDHLLFKSKKALKEELSVNPNVDLRTTLMNLANVYDDIGRTVEAIGYYEYIIEQCGSAYALLNKGISLYNYSSFINNPTPILSEAYDYFKFLLNDSRSSIELKQKASFYIGKIKFLFDENILDENPSSELERPSNESFEGFSINYCLDKRLYLNLCNFCQRCENSVGDNLVIEKMIREFVDDVEDDLFLVLSSYLNQIKMDYVSARFLLMLSQFEDFDLDVITKHVYIMDTQFAEENDIRVQLLKDSFKNFFNILDKISYFLNQYLDLAIPQNRVQFRNIWFKNGNKKEGINDKLLEMDNVGLTALYDIYLEVEYGNEKEYLRKTRNNLTHKYLRITNNKRNETDKTVEELQDETIEIAILAKNAIFYLMRLIKINEELREEDLGIDFHFVDEN